MKTLVFALMLMIGSFSSSAMGYPQSVFSHQRVLTQQIELKKVNVPTKIEPLKLADENFRENLINSAIFIAEKIIKWFM